MADAATRIARARRSAHLSQAVLARRAGTSQPAVNRYEKGRSVPSEATLRRILEACSPGRRPRDALLGHREEVLRRLQRDGAKQVFVFGSVARGEDGPDSDIDLLVDHLDEQAYSWAVPRVAAELEELLGFTVDVAEVDALRPSVLAAALHDARPL
jgi:predicted nucleotidyltransferase/DNA-binding XRE family transcriptional regulator